MNNLGKSIIYGLLAFIMALGLFSIISSCVPVGAVGAGLGVASCLTPEQATRVDANLNLRLVEALDDAASGAITGEELTLRLRDSLVSYGQELREAIVTDTASIVAGTIGGATQKATEQGGAIGAATAVLGYLMRELSWRTKRKPELEKKSQ